MDLSLIGSGSYANVWASETHAYKVPSTEDFYDELTVSGILIEGLFLRCSYGIPISGLCHNNHGLTGFRMMKAAGTLRNIYKSFDKTFVHTQLPAWCSELAYQLDAMHFMKWVHGDLKSANILVSPNGKAFLCDFGLSMPEDHTCMAHNLGTMEYRAPELLARGYDSVAAHKSHDIWALGMSVLEVLQNDLPTSGCLYPNVVLQRLQKVVPEDDKDRQALFQASFGTTMGLALAAALDWNPLRRSMDGLKRLARPQETDHHVFFQDCLKIGKRQRLQMDVLDLYDIPTDVWPAVKISQRESCESACRDFGKWALLPTADVDRLGKDAIRLVAVFLQHAFCVDQPLLQSVLAAHIVMHSRKVSISCTVAYKMACCSCAAVYEASLRRALVPALQDPRWCSAMCTLVPMMQT